MTSLDMGWPLIGITDATRQQTTNWPPQRRPGGLAVSPGVRVQSHVVMAPGLGSWNQRRRWARLEEHGRPRLPGEVEVIEDVAEDLHVLADVGTRVGPA